MKAESINVRGRQETGTRVGVRTLLQRMRNAVDVRTDGTARIRLASVQQRQAELTLFCDRYEEFVETLCDAAQYGPSPHLEGAYERIRNWIDVNHEPIRRFVGAYLTPQETDAFRFEVGRPPDAFELLYAAPTLKDFLSRDDGDMILRITDTREALNLYGEHLRQLSARIA